MIKYGMDKFELYYQMAQAQLQDQADRNREVEYKATGILGLAVTLMGISVIVIKDFSGSPDQSLFSGPSDMFLLCPWENPEYHALALGGVTRNWLTWSTYITERGIPGDKSTIPFSTMRGFLKLESLIAACLAMHTLLAWQARVRISARLPWTGPRWF